MSLTGTNVKTYYPGPGGTVFPTTFKIYAASEVVVEKLDQTTGETVSTLVLDTDYTVAGVGNAAATVTLLSDLGSYALLLRRVTALTQGTRMPDTGTFYPSTVEAALDHSMAVLQEHDAKLNRTPHLSPQTEGFTAQLAGVPAPLDVVSVNAAGDGFELRSIDEIATASYTITTVKDHTATAGQTVFTTAAPYVPHTNGIAVYRNGVRLVSISDYDETDDNSITLTVGADLGDTISVVSSEGVGDPTGLAAANTLRSDLASPLDLKGPALIGFDEGNTYSVGTAGAAIQARPTSATLASTVGAALIGLQKTSGDATTDGVFHANRKYNFKTDFGAKGDNTNDDAALVKAIASGAIDLEFPPGIYNFTAGVTLPDWAHWHGPNLSLGMGSATVSNSATLNFNLASGTAITCGAHPILERLNIWCSASTYDNGTDTLTGTTATGILTNGNITMREVSLSGWYIAHKPGGSAFYSKFMNCEFVRNFYANYSTSITPYNVTFDSCRASKNERFWDGTTFARNIKVIGGSIEAFRYGFKNYYQVSCFGTYFEVYANFAGAIGFDPGNTYSSTSLFGCDIYLNYFARFINLSGLANQNLTSIGNKLQADEASADGAKYVYLPTSPSTVVMHGDVASAGGTSPDSGWRGTTQYVDTFANMQLYNIHHPIVPSTNAYAPYSDALFTGAPTFRTNTETIQAKAYVNNGATTTYTYPAKTRYVYMTTTAASMAVTFPAASAGINGLVLEIVFSAAVATATWSSSGATFVGAPAAIAANTPYRFIYDSSQGKWFPF